MNCPRKTVLLLLACFGLATSLLATVPDQYQTIVDRNAFGLNPPPPPQDPNNPTNNAPPPNVTLTGFTRMGGQLRAYFVVKPKDPKEQPQYLSLAENQREGVLEVVKISEADGEVRIRNSGTESIIALKDNKPAAPKLGPGVVPAPMPPAGAAPAMPGAAAASPVYNPSAPSSVVASYNNKVVAGAQPTTPPMPGIQPGIQPGVQPGMQTAPGVMPNTAPSPSTIAGPRPLEGLRTIPTRTLRLPQSSGAAQ